MGVKLNHFFFFLYIKTMQKSGDKHVKLAFYSGKGDIIVLANLVKTVSGDFVHVEILFPDEKHGYVAFSIEQNGTVFLRPKTFGRKDWEYVTISGLSSSALKNMKNEAFTIFSLPEEHKQFSMDSMIRSVLPTARKKSDYYSGHFCSKLCVQILHKGGLLTNLNPNATTPSSLFRAVHIHIPREQVYKSSSHLFKKRVLENGGLKLSSIKEAEEEEEENSIV